MTPIVLDDNLVRRLHKVNGPVEFRDASGQVVGHFIPTIVDMSEWEPVTPEVSEEELDQREQSNDWLTTEEVLAHLKNMEKQ